jgi:hypothetical protein
LIKAKKSKKRRENGNYVHSNPQGPDSHLDSNPSSRLYPRSILVYLFIITIFYFFLTLVSFCPSHFSSAREERGRKREERSISPLPPFLFVLFLIRILQNCGFLGVVEHILGCQNKWVRTADSLKHNKHIQKKNSWISLHSILKKIIKVKPARTQKRTEC